MADNISQFSSPVDKLQPSETGAEALARVGRIEMENYHQAGEAYGKTIGEVGQKIENYETMQEISQGSAALAVMHNNLTTQWNQTAQNTDPNDTTIQQKYMEGAQNQLETWQNSFNTKRGQEWAMGQADSMRSHLWDKTNADMGARAGNAIVNNMKTTLNNLSDTARKDPSTIDQSLSHVDALVSASKEHAGGFLNQEESNKIDNIASDMKNEIVKSGIMGMADKDPQSAINMINSGVMKDHVSGPEAEQLTKYAEGVHRMQLEDQRTAEMNKERQQKEVDEAATDKVINGLYNPDTGQLSIPDDVHKQIWQMQGVSGKTKMALLGAVRNMSREDVVDDPQMVKDLAGRMMSNSSNPLTQDDLLKSMSEGKITPSTFNFFNTKLDNGPDAETAKQTIARSMRETEDKLANTLYGQNGVLSVPKDVNEQIMSSPGIGGKEKMELINRVSVLQKKSGTSDAVSEFAGRLSSTSDNPLTTDDLDKALQAKQISKSDYNFFNSKLNGKSKDDPEVFQDFSSRLQTDTPKENRLTHKELVDALSNGDITKQSMKFFEDQLSNNPYSSKGQEGPGLLSSAYSRFQQWFMSAYQSASKDPSLNGMSGGQKANALLTPGSKQYMLHDENMKQFQPTGDDIIKDAIPSINASQLQPAPIQRQQGEVPTPPAPGTPERKEWLKKVLLNGG